MQLFFVVQQVRPRASFGESIEEMEGWVGVGLKLYLLFIYILSECLEIK